ncbi:MAG TPA: sortase [Patescibacteria group bacterium]|nr:sortase [Patescibacteria group bacterium]
MSLYVYKKRKQKKYGRIVRFTAYVLLIIGSLFLFWSFYPIISFELYARFFLNKPLVSPVPSTIAAPLAQARSVLGAFNVVSTNLSDYTKAGVWFPEAPQDESTIKLEEYFLSIPKINVENAKVIVGGEDLSKSLIHYIPKSYPGEKGNVTIFGHSTLPQLYNPKDYKTIFTYLPSLTKGDTVSITVGTITYQYEIFDTFVVNPDQVSVLDQQLDDAYLTLITCVPPGTYWKRLIVKARLSKI